MRREVWLPVASTQPCIWVHALSPKPRPPNGTPPLSVALLPSRKSAKVPLAPVLGTWLRSHAEPQTVSPAEVFSATS